MELQGRYTWTGNNRYGSNHRHLRIHAKGTFELRRVSSAGAMGSSGSTLKGRVERGDGDRFVLVGEADESWTHDDDNWSQEHPSTTRLDVTVLAPGKIDVAGDLYEPELLFEERLGSPAALRALLWLAALAAGILAWRRRDPALAALVPVLGGLALNFHARWTRVTDTEVRTGWRWTFTTFPRRSVKSATVIGKSVEIGMGTRTLRVPARWPDLLARALREP